MAPVIRLTDGVSVVNLNSGGILCTAYPMSSPETSEDVIQNIGDGDSLAVPTWRNVTESLSLLVTGANPAAVRDSIQSAERLLDKARQNRLTWRGVRVWIEIQFDHDTAVWRSEILAGRLVHGDIADDIWRAKVEASLIITRRYFWEGPETQLELSSAGTGTPTLNYVTVYNNDDASANTNWFQVAAAQVKGVIPSPLRLEILNNSGAGIPIKSLHMGNYVHMDAANIDPILRGEQASYTDASWTGMLETVIARWALPKALIDDIAGQYCRILVALSTLPSSSTLARARLQYSFSGDFVDLAVGEQVKNNGEAILDLGAMPIPTGGFGIGSNTLTYLAITMQAAISGGDSAGVDWLQIMPAGHGLYRQLRTIISGMGVEDDNALVDDGIEGLTYILNSADSETYVSYRGIHTPLHVWPDVLNRFRLMKQGYASLGTTATFGLKAFYRERRLTV